MSMSLDTPVGIREKVRVFVTGSCDGLPELREALERHSEVEIVGIRPNVKNTCYCVEMLRKLLVQGQAVVNV